jgi:dienelactone hydrolase
MNSPLPDLFRLENGQHVETVPQWRQRRAEMLDQILDIEYGHLPPVPERVLSETLNEYVAANLDQAKSSQHRLQVGNSPALDFRLDLLVPAGSGPFPVVLSGDGCWHTVSDEVKLAVLRRGYALAVFSRAEIVPDNRHLGRTTGLYRLYPQGDYGAISAWAWGFHRCVDFLIERPELDPNCIAVIGFSRGGKAALLAGAMDERIALTVANNSGCGGAGCHRWRGEGSEALEDCLKAFPHWFSPRLQEYIGKESQLPFDQHYLKALVAPRSLLTTEALGDLWANPEGTWLTHQAAREAYRFLQAEEKNGIWFRDGGHQLGIADWKAFLDFADWQFKGIVSTCRFDVSPVWAKAASGYPAGGVKNG